MRHNYILSSPLRNICGHCTGLSKKPIPSLLYVARSKQVCIEWMEATVLIVYLSEVEKHHYTNALTYLDLATRPLPPWARSAEHSAGYTS